MFPDLHCQLNTADCDRCRIEAHEAKHRPDSVFDPSVILLNHQENAAYSAGIGEISTPFFCLPFDDAGGCPSAGCADAPPFTQLWYARSRAKR